MTSGFDKKRMVGFARLVLPPIVSRWLKKIVDAIRGAPFEYVPEGWARGHSVRGWNVESVLRAYQSRWDELRGRIGGNDPLGVASGARVLSNADIIGHNLVMTFGYVLSQAYRDKTSLSILDWGGGIGHYRLLAGALFPGFNIEYHCKEVPMVCELGRQMSPDTRFYESDAEYAGSRFDLVMAIGSLQYAENWKDVLNALARTTEKYLYITRLPIVENVPSYVMVQRPCDYGYDTEYLSWCLNRNEFMDAVTQRGLRLVREFVTGENIEIARAPEQCTFRGFLFRASGLS